MNNKVCIGDIVSMIDSAETQEHTFWGKEHIISYRLKNGFTVTGRSACVDPANFDIDIGRDLCRKDAISQMWLLEGYLLQCKIAEIKDIKKELHTDERV